MKRKSFENIIAFTNRFIIHIIFLLALTLRLTYTLVVCHQERGNTSVFMGPYAAKWNDSYEYLNVAENFMKYKVISTGKYPNLTPYIYKPPLYPIFIGLMGAVKNLWPVIIFQLVLSSTIVFLIYYIAKLIWNIKIIAVSAAFLFAINLQSIVYSPLILTETLFTITLTLSVFLLIRFIKIDKIRDLYFSFTLLIIAIFIRPVSYFYYLFILLTILLYLINKKGISFGLMHFLTLLSLFIVSVGAWQIRNYKLTEYAGFSSVSIDFKYSYITPEILSKKNSENLIQIQKSLAAGAFADNYFNLFPEQKNWSAGKILKSKEMKANEIIKRNKFSLFKLQFLGMIKTMIKRIDYASFLIYPIKNAKPFFIKWIFNSFYLLNVTALILCCFSLVIGWKNGYCYWIVISTIFYFITFAGILNLERYRVPVMPLILLISSFTAYKFLYQTNHHKQLIGFKKVRNKTHNENIGF